MKAALLCLLLLLSATGLVFGFFTGNVVTFVGCGISLTSATYLLGRLDG